MVKERLVCAVFFFFFQAEDGIRDLIVTGVQTCALPVLGGVLPLTVRLTEDDGPILPSRPVRATLEGGAYASGTTDTLGYWTFNFDTRGLLSKRYTLVAIYDGDRNFTAAQVTTRVLVE